MNKKMMVACMTFTILLTLIMWIHAENAFAALTNENPVDQSVKLDWASTGSSPFNLYRDDTLIYSGSDTTYTDSSLEYGKSYDYRLDYQHYEETKAGYYQSTTYWGVLEPSYTYPSQEYQIIDPAHYDTISETVAWCKWTSSDGITYSHATPCDVSSHETTITQSKEVWVPDQYGWVDVTVTVPAVYGWVPKRIWVSATYGYVTRSSTLTVKIPMPPTPPEFNQIVVPAEGDVFGGSRTTFVPTVTVSDVNGDTLSLTYVVDNETSPRETRQISNTVTEQTVSFSSLDVGSWVEGKHQIVFKAYDGTYTTKQTVDIYVDKTLPVLVDVQMNSTADSISVKGSATDAMAGLDANPYRYKVGTHTGSWTGQTAYTQAGLTPNTDYAVSFEARDKVGLDAVKQLQIYTKAQVPVVQMNQSGETSLKISFNDDNPSTTEYMIQCGMKYVDDTGKLTSSPKWIIPVNKQITIYGLKNNTTYAIKAKARNEGLVETVWSSPIDGLTLAAPPKMSYKVSQHSIILSWPAISGVYDYQVEADGQVVSIGTTSSWTHSGLQSDTSHTYRLRVINAAGSGRWSSPLTIYTWPDPPPVPGGLQGVPSQTQVSLIWDEVPRVEHYDIEDNGQIVHSVTSAAFIETGLTAESQHVYRVRAGNKGGNSEWSQPITITTLPYPPPTPQDVKGEKTNHSVTVSWDSSVRATGYEIEVDGVIIDNGNSTMYVHNGLKPLSGHTYRVRATNIGGKSPWSDPLDVTTNPDIPSIPDNIIATANENSITITWYQVATAESYDVEVDGTEIVHVKNPQFVHAGLDPDTIHTYRLRAKNITGASNWSNLVKMSTFPESTSSGSGTLNTSLTNVVAIVTNSYITLSWDAVAQNVEYDIEVDGKLINNGSDTVYHHTGLNPDEYHIYKIRVRDKNGISDWVAILSLATLLDPPDAPGNIDAFATNSSIELKWEKVNGATGYDIEVDGKTIDAGTTQDYIDDNLTSGTSHTYRIRAKNITGVTAWSKDIVASTTSPTYTVAVQKDQPISFSLLATNVQDFSDKLFIVIYDPTELDVADLNDFTPERDVLSEGDIPGTNLHVVYTPGKIIFTVNKNIVPGTSWSGELTTIQFLSKIDGHANLDFKVE